MIKKEKIEPIISEKSTGLVAQGWYSFRAPKHLGKKEAAAIIEHIFKVNVKRVNVCVKRSKPRRAGRFSGQTKEYKKIMIKLKKGQKIDAFEITS